MVRNVSILEMINRRSLDTYLLHLLMAFLGGLDLALALEIVSRESWQVLALTGPTEVQRSVIVAKESSNERF